MKFDINLDGGDYVFNTKVGGVLVEIFRVTSAGSATFTGTVQATAGLTGAGSVPVGGIISWVPGYFGNGSNGFGAGTPYTRMLGATDDVSGANGYLSALGFAVCDGSALNDSLSPIFNGVSRYLPNLTDKRFLQGSMSVVVAAGEVDTWNILGNIQGGSLLMTDHTHAVSGIGVSTINISHTHGFGTLSNAGEASHTHGSGSYATSLGLSGSVTGTFASTGHTHTLGAGYALFGEVPAWGQWGAVVRSVTSWNTTVYGPSGSASAQVAACTLGTSLGGTTDGPTGQATVGGGYSLSGSNNVTGSSDVGSSHTHTISGSTATGGSATLAGPTLSGVAGTGNTATNTDNRPKYLRCFYIMRVH